MERVRRSLMFQEAGSWRVLFRICRAVIDVSTFGEHWQYGAEVQQLSGMLCTLASTMYSKAVKGSKGCSREQCKVHLPKMEAFQALQVRTNKKRPQIRKGRKTGHRLEYDTSPSTQTVDFSKTGMQRIRFTRATQAFVLIFPQQHAGASLGTPCTPSKLGSSSKASASPRHM